MSDAPVQQPKKKVIRIKKKTQVEQSSTLVDNNETVNEESSTEQNPSEEKELISLIPSSRVKNYLSKEKLNKEFDHLISKIKNANNSNESLDLSTLLTEEMQIKIGSIIKQKEENKEDVNINNIAVDLLSKHKFKFSHSSFKVLSVFLDLLIEDLTVNVMDEVIKNKKTIINTKYIYTAAINSPLYPIYSTLATFVNGQQTSDDDLQVEDVQTEEVSTEESQTEETSPEETNDEHSINFEFYIRKICNKLKKTKDEYTKIKVSNNYQKFCSNLVLEFLDLVAPITTILLEVMTTKTISQLVFETVLKLQLYNNPNKDSIFAELHKRLSN